MTEELYQVQDTTTNDDLFADESVEEEEDLFGDWTPEESDKPTETNKEENQTSSETKVEKTDGKEAQVVSSQPNPSFLTIKYNKEEKGLTQEEAIEYAQKGMNYDNILGKYNALKDSEGTLKELNRLAQANEMSLEDYVKGLTDVQNQYELNKEVESLKQLYPNSDDKLIKELAEQHLKDKTNLVSKKQDEEAKAKKQEISRQMDVFNKRYPNVDPSKLESQVYDLMKEGYTLLEAYESVSAIKREAQEKERASLEAIAKQNEENKKKSIGNLNNNGYQEEDEFLQGLFS